MQEIRFQCSQSISSILVLKQTHILRRLKCLNFFKHKGTNEFLGLIFACSCVYSFGDGNLGESASGKLESFPTGLSQFGFSEAKTHGLCRKDSL